jgi:hypothetical protein
VIFGKIYSTTKSLNQNPMTDKVAIPLKYIKLRKQDDWLRKQKILVNEVQKSQTKLKKRYTYPRRRRRATEGYTLRVLLRWYDKTYGYPNPYEKEKIAKKINWSFRRINKWFNNRRTKHRVEYSMNKKSG